MHLLSRVLIILVPIVNFSCGTLLGQKTDRQTFFGQLQSEKDQSPVGYATILNTISKQLVYSDSIGNFNIPVTNGDTLSISRIGFYNKQIPVSSIHLNTKKLQVIYLTAREYDLKTVTINQLGSYNEFKYKVINTPLPKPEYEINPAVFNGLNQKPVVLQEQASISLGSPVTAIYMLLSKEGKTLRKLEKLKAEERDVQSYSDKYSPLIVSQLTGLKDLELEKFMKFCNPDINFIKNSTEYDIAAKILECFKNYNSQNVPDLNQPKP